MDEREISRNECDLVYLIACALHNIPSEEAVIAGMDFDALYRLAQRHSLTAITCMGLENGNALSHCGPELARKWKETKEKAIRKNLLLDAERQKILAEFEKARIWYMPLKGAILKDLYPKLGMRQMADNDILFDASRAKEVKRLFEDQGYHCGSYGTGVHDAYEKPPVMEFEMHRALFHVATFPEWAEKYSDVKKHLSVTPGTKYGFHFSDEDFYVYITAHAHKHFANNGTGLRTLVDFYVYYWKKGAFLNWDYVYSELESMGLADYERNSRRLANLLFSAPNPNIVQKLSEEEKELLCYYLESGTYGTRANFVNNKMKQLQDDGQPVRRLTKVRYIFSRLFPDRKWFRTLYPFLYRNPWFIPFFWAYRIVRGVCGPRAKKLLQELQILLKVH